MAKKRPNYVHCAKCGYRGIDQEHDCTQVRAAAAAVVEQAARRAEATVYVARELTARELAERAGPVEVVPPSTATHLMQLSVEHSRGFGRHVTFNMVTNAPIVDDRLTAIEIRQRCAACCSDIDKRITLDLADPLAALQLGAAARKAYLLHRCPPAESSLLGFTYDELDVLFAELEREIDTIGRRLAEVDAIRKAQAR